jgi:hypothetical protein
VSTLAFSRLESLKPMRDFQSARAPINDYAVFSFDLEAGASWGRVCMEGPAAAAAGSGGGSGGGGGYSSNS